MDIVGNVTETHDQVVKKYADEGFSEGLFLFFIQCVFMVHNTDLQNPNDELREIYEAIQGTYGKDRARVRSNVFNRLKNLQYENGSYYHEKTGEIKLKCISDYIRKNLAVTPDVWRFVDCRDDDFTTPWRIEAVEVNTTSAIDWKRACRFALLEDMLAYGSINSNYGTVDIDRFGLCLIEHDTKTNAIHSYELSYMFDYEFDCHYVDWQSLTGAQKLRRYFNDCESRNINIPNVI